MNASQPEAVTKYSTRDRPPDGLGTPRGRGRQLVLGLGLTGSALLLAAELTPLLRVTTVARHPMLVRTLQTGPHHGWALVPIATLAVILAVAASRGASAGRLPHVLLALLGLGALGVALLVDLPDAHARGLVGAPATGLHTAVAHAAIGLYLETLGAIVLLLAAGMGAARAPRAASRAAAARNE